MGIASHQISFFCRFVDLKDISGGAQMCKLIMNGS